MASRRVDVSSHRLLAAVALSALVVSVNYSAKSAEPVWSQQPYKYIAIDQDLRDALTEFGRNIGVPTKISEAVAGSRVRSEFSAGGPREFLQHICKSYGLVWYFDGTVLYINSANEVRTEQITLNAVRADKLMEKLTALKVADSRYAVNTAQNGRVVSVSGPPPFVTLVRQTIAAWEKSLAPRSIREVTGGDDQEVRVFRGGS